MEQVGKNVIATSAEGTPISATFHNETKSGVVMQKMRGKKEYSQLGLEAIIKSCPPEFLPVLTEHINTIKRDYNATPRELAIAADVLVANLEAYVEKTVKKPMTPKEAIEEVRQFLAQQESDTIH